MNTAKTICSTKVTRLVLVIENRMLREAMTALFQKQPDFFLLDSIRYSADAHKRIASSDCDVLLAETGFGCGFPFEFRQRCAGAFSVSQGHTVRNGE